MGRLKLKLTRMVKQIPTDIDIKLLVTTEERTCSRRLEEERLVPYVPCISINKAKNGIKLTAKINAVRRVLIRIRVVLGIMYNPPLGKR